jgi:hypothetical protein
LKESTLHEDPSYDDKPYEDSNQPEEEEDDEEEEEKSPEQMRPIFGMSIKQNKYIDTDEDEQDQVFSDLPRQHTNEDESDDEDDLYGD